MAGPSPIVQAALASLQERWGGAAPRWGGEVLGALAVAPQARPESTPEIVPLDERAVPTGFRALDAILGLGGLPRGGTTAIEGDGTSGKTTLALSAISQVQARGGIAAYLDLARSLDPIEAAARGVQLDWLVVLTPVSLEEALAMAATLLQDRAVDLLLLDLPLRALDPAGPSAGRLGDRLHRLVALARKANVQLLVLEPPGLPAAIRIAVAETAALRLELSRRAWIRLGRDVVGQRTEVRVARNRFGPPGRTAELRILYADGGPRDACLARDELLGESRPGSSHRPVSAIPGATARPAAAGGSGGAAPPGARRPADPPSPPARTRFSTSSSGSSDATPPPLLATSPPPPRPRPILHALSGGSPRPGGPAVDRRPGARREQGRARTGRPAGDTARDGSPARP